MSDGERILCWPMPGWFGILRRRPFGWFGGTQGARLVRVLSQTRTIQGVDIEESQTNEELITGSNP